MFQDTIVTDTVKLEPTNDTVLLQTNTNAEATSAKPIDLSSKNPPVEIEKELALNFSKLKPVDSLQLSSKPFWAFIEKPLPREGMVGKPKVETEFGILLIPILLIGFLLTRIKPFRNKKIFQYLNAAVSNRFFRQIFREEESSLNPTGILLFSIYIISTALLVFNAFLFLSEGVPSSVANKLFFLTLLVVLGLFFLKALGIWATLGLLNSRENIETYHFQYLLFTKVLGLFLIVPAILSSFGYYEFRAFFVYLGLAIYGLMFALRIGKSLVIGIGSRLAEWQYIILYICTLEIAPLVIIVKSLRI